MVEPTLDELMLQIGCPNTEKSRARDLELLEMSGTCRSIHHTICACHPCNGECGMYIIRAAKKEDNE